MCLKFKRGILWTMTEIDVTYQGSLSTECVHQGNHQKIRTDAPKDNQGKGEMFSPTDLFATALASCVLTLMGIQAMHLKIDIPGAKATVTKEMSQDAPRRIAKLTLLITVPHTFPQEIVEKLERAGKNCPVAMSLHPDIVVNYDFSWGIV